MIHSSLPMAAQNAAPGAQLAPLDADLAAIGEGWGLIPDAVKVGICPPRVEHKGSSPFGPAPLAC
ncbi:hypothetical protein [Adhaeretor mobilis]|uniref:Uncharacterized protein n=1 Tax=Adhaeretor mobilis TaxID=1930276 RepID=A0A517MUB6_9BACT|nr:hypothetical protein [Adhaeretor mobilis]QDS98462.1 hypothetical protein HG15A2_17420 [Adhaeretor mobilis]